MQKILAFKPHIIQGMCIQSTPRGVGTYNQVKRLQCCRATFQHVQERLSSHDEHTAGFYSLGPQLSIDGVL